MWLRSERAARRGVRVARLVACMGTTQAGRQAGEVYRASCSPCVVVTPISSFHSILPLPPRPTCLSPRVLFILITPPPGPPHTLIIIDRPISSVHVPAATDGQTRHYYYCCMYAGIEWQKRARTPFCVALQRAAAAAARPCPARSPTVSVRACLMRCAIHQPGKQGDGC